MDFAKAKRSEKTETPTLSLQEAAEFVEFYGQQMSKIDQSIIEEEDKLQEAKDKLTTLSLKRSSLSGSSRTTELVREVTISLNCNATGKVIDTEFYEC